MAGSESRLAAWYRNRIDAPATEEEVRGYWVFAAGVVVGVLGLLFSLLGGPASGLRELAVVLGAGGLVLLLAGPVIRLPLGGTPTLLAYGGVAISALGLVWFVLAFPQNWSTATGHRGVIALYGFGLAVIAVGGVVLPLSSARTAERGPGAGVESGSESDSDSGSESELASEPESEPASGPDSDAPEDGSALDAELDSLRAALADAEADEADLAARVRELRRELTGARDERETREEELDAVRAALADAEADEADLAAELRELRESRARFEVYEDRGGEHRWRLRHRNGNVIATSGEGYTRRHNARKGLASVRRNGLGAELVEVETEADLPEEAPEPPESQATFEVFADAGEEYRWRLRHRNGNVLADSGEGYATASNARRALRGVRETVGPADYLWFDPAGFETYRDKGGEYRWRLVHRNGNVIATGGEGYATHGNARRAVRRLRERVDEFEREVYEDRGGEYRWRLRAANDEIVATSGEGYIERGGAETALERVRELTPEADTLEVGLATFEIFADAAEEYRWRLRHRNGNVLADCGEGYASRGGVRDAIESVKRHVPDAALDVE
jgi:uncharacterized protein YegP (UPF0339 family)